MQACKNLRKLFIFIGNAHALPIRNNTLLKHSKDFPINGLNVKRKLWMFFCEKTTY